MNQTRPADDALRGVMKCVRVSLLLSLLLCAGAGATEPEGVSAAGGAARSTAPAKSAAHAEPAETTAPLADDAASPSPSKETAPPATTNATVDRHSEAPPDAPTRAPAQPTRPKPIVDPSVSSEALAWIERVDALIARIGVHEAGATDANRMYPELGDALDRQRDAVSRSLTAGWQELERQQNLYAALYDARIRLFAWLSPDMQTRLTGGGRAGMQELQDELSYMALYLGHKAITIPNAALQLIRNLAQAPLAMAWKLLQLLVVLVLFREWRRWARTALPAAHERLLRARPRTASGIRTARSIWYVEQIRNPLEWLIVVWALRRWTADGELSEVTAFLFTILFWLLSARLAVAMFHATAVRGGAGLGRDPDGLRLRSIRLVAAWLLLLGLGLDLTATYAGEAALYTWVWRLFEWLALPVAAILVRWWRPEIFRQLGEEPDPPAWVARALVRRTGPRSYLTAAAGGVHLVAHKGLRVLARRISSFEAGRRLFAVLSRSDATRDEMEAETAQLDPLPEDRLEAMLHDTVGCVNEIGQVELSELCDLVDGGADATIAIVAERGGGKTTMLKRLAETCTGRTRWIDCPPGGYEAFRAALLEALELAPDADPMTDVGPRLRECGIRLVVLDDLHRLARPAMGGLNEIDLVSAIIGRAGKGTLWAVGVGREAWQYIKAASGARVMMNEVITLPSWTEEQIAELLELRASRADLKPEFRHLALSRQLDDGGYEGIEDRRRHGFFRVVWDLADGNPEVAAQLFAQSLMLDQRGQVRVCLPKPPLADGVHKAGLTVRLVLRVMVQTELATVDHLVDSLRLSRAEVGNALRFCVQSGWAEEVLGHYRLTWRWYRTITRVLTRQGLLAR